MQYHNANLEFCLKMNRIDFAYFPSYFCLIFFDNPLPVSIIKMARG